MTDAEALDAAEGQISGGLPELVDQLLDLALGERAEGTADDGGTVYLRPPNFLACRYLVDRILGKPTERAEVSGGVVDVGLLDDAALRALVASYGVEGGASAGP